MTLRQERAVRRLLGQQVRLAREGCGLTQGELAKVMDMHRITINLLEQGKGGVTNLVTLADVAYACDTSVAELLEPVLGPRGPL